MSTTVLDPPRTLRVCLFRLSGELLALDVRWAREVVVLEDLTAVPRTPVHLVGVANLRGHILPILDIRPLLGLAPGRTGRGSRALVIEAASFQVAVAIDEILGLTSIAEVIPLGEAARREFGEFGLGLLEREDGLATLLDAPKILEALRVGASGKGD
jgi:purine-binding chemotaxis protein CheW